MAKASSESRYSSRIIKAGALLPDSRLLLENWDVDVDVRTNLDRITRENLFGKASRSRVEDVLAVFRQRYLEDPEVSKALVALARAGMPAGSLDRILYFQAARSDLLMHDLVTELLNGWSGRGDRHVYPREVEEWVEEQVQAGKTGGPWSPPVRRRVVQGLLSALRDFGILEGSVKKRLAHVHLPTSAFAFAAFQLHAEGRSGRALLGDPEWRLFLLAEGAVERHFLEAHQGGLLEYHAAGSVVRIDFPVHDLERYARVLVGPEHQTTRS